jgi:sugar/nucleoside kinase (ribokinase family)
MIVVAGAAHFDRLGQTTAPSVLEKSNPGSFYNTLGGAALNVASSLAALGQDVTLVSCVGDDASGHEVINGVATRGVTPNIAPLPQHQTATYTAIVDNKGDLVIALADMACYDHFDPQTAAQSIAKLSPSDWLLIDANLPAPAIANMISMASCNIAAMTVSSAKANRLISVLDKVDIVFTNISEAKALMDLGAAATTDDIVTGLRKCGVSNAVITNGADNVIVSSDDLHHEVAIQPQTVADVTGAGDGMVAGCLYHLMRGKPLNEAVNTGIRVAQEILKVSGPYVPDLKSKLAVSKDK